jgi:hypothetical protein
VRSVPPRPRVVLTLKRRSSWGCVCAVRPCIVSFCAGAELCASLRPEPPAELASTLAHHIRQQIQVHWKGEPACTSEPPLLAPSPPARGVSVFKISPARSTRLVGGAELVSRKRFQRLSLFGCARVRSEWQAGRPGLPLVAGGPPAAVSRAFSSWNRSILTEI